MGQGRLRHKTPSWVMTCMTWPSRRIRARSPASGEPAAADGIGLRAGPKAPFLPASARARWREQWLGELRTLSAAARITFAAHARLASHAAGA
jgi:hypothetical protein